MKTVRVPFWPTMIGIAVIGMLLFSLVGKVGDQEKELRRHPSWRDDWPECEFREYLARGKKVLAPVNPLCIPPPGWDKP